MSAFANKPPIFDILADAAGAVGTLDYGTFTRLVLHHPEHGYYRKNRLRVGKTDGTDFYTAASFGALFGKLVRAAAVSLLGEEWCRQSTLVEIGAEPEQMLFNNEVRFFAEVKTLRAGEKLLMPSRAVVFSNELLDAQPFHRLIFREGKWRELGVRIVSDLLAECVLDDFANEQSQAFAATLPIPWHEGWMIDAPLGAEALLRELASQRWTGALIFFDYGKMLVECLENSPEGTARAYQRHRQHNDLLVAPGEQDLTCHVLWDRLETVLCKTGFSDIRVDRQEAFFMRRANAVVAEILASPDAGLEHERSQLRALLHPAHFGHKFQVLSAIRKTAVPTG